MKLRFISFIIALFWAFSLFAIQVKIESPRLDLDAKNNVGNGVISAHCKLNIIGIKGKSFDLVAIVKDDNGDWHSDSYGNTVKTHYSCRADYENTTWQDIQVYLPHSKLAPKSGKHTYKVYLYVYYNSNWYGGTYAGSYDLTGKQSDNHSVSRSSSSNRRTTTKSSQKSVSSSSRSKRNDLSTMKINCVVCHGTGVCQNCGGLGYTVPMYGYSRGEQVACGLCFGTGKCRLCQGKGYSVAQSANGGVYIDGVYHSGETHSNTSRRSSKSSSGICDRCNGTGVNSHPMYIDDPSGAGVNAVGHTGYTHSSGRKCSYCGKYRWHIHLKCTKCGYRN